MTIPGKGGFSTCDLELLRCVQAILAPVNGRRWWNEVGINMDSGTYVGMEVHLCTGVENLQERAGCSTGPARSDRFLGVV